MGRAGDINALRQALLIGFANRLAFRMQRNNGYKTLGQRPVLSQLHPSTSRIKADEDGLLPEWLIYNELIATQRPFLSKASRHILFRTLPRPPPLPLSPKLFMCIAEGWFQVQRGHPYSAPTRSQRQVGTSSVPWDPPLPCHKRTCYIRVITVTYVCILASRIWSKLVMLSVSRGGLAAKPDGSPL